MEKIWQELFNVLADLLSAYQKMLELGNVKREALISAKVKEIEAVTKQEETLIIFINQADKIRKDLVEKIATHYQLTQETMSLSKIKQFASPDMEQKLADIELNFHNAVDELQKLNKTNNELIQQALHFVNFNINVLTQNVASMNYAPGQQEQSTAKAVFDRKI